MALNKTVGQMVTITGNVNHKGPAKEFTLAIAILPGMTHTVVILTMPDATLTKYPFAVTHDITPAQAGLTLDIEVAVFDLASPTPGVPLATASLPAAVIVAPVVPIQAFNIPLASISIT